MGTPADMPKVMRPRKYGGAILLNGVNHYRSETSVTDAPTNPKDKDNDRPY
ncbi:MULTISPECIES: hypothetical protein [unclassified Rhodococcus (in: high G+C Gram-positive bacteria)]|uniref:hypothetical protein n=1 Tax=unclassified Rhodococcus (in: high G+C Gram-positive bacteria) TaxID=192944 RepID=UPI002952C332|nr:hypothetical protein [Rhodococcus sp. IEGM 1343]MDV8055072.1 hypothetical protein [Rhodococcus sp. IEGM 1343]